jgi:predicted Rossmann fold nucleotide-binding protein DprA/Smf involved in DNA uptake
LTPESRRRKPYEFGEIGPEANAAHRRVAYELKSKGAKILTLGAAGYPDLLFELNGEVFAAEVKGKFEHLRDQQITVIDGLRRLKKVYVIRESGNKLGPDEITLQELLSELLGSHGNDAE